VWPWTVELSPAGTDLWSPGNSLSFCPPSLISSLIMLDSNIVAVSLPAIGRSLSAGFTDI
jgi:hypothetical protein